MANPSAQSKASAPDGNLRSVHTTSFPILLDQCGISLLVSTYQAGKLIVLRNENGVLNTHFRNFQVPMGVAEERGRLAIGTQCHVWEYRNHVAAASKLEPPGRHDACYLPRAAHVTGDIRIHELAWAGDELWLVNTRFSCLCTLDGDNSFVPRWQPPFISALAPEDRCHLNGLGIRDGAPRYVTCLGRTDVTDGWRAHKVNGGCLLEVPGGAILADGLSMPHSPRWYQDHLWFLESGHGALVRLEENGERRNVAQMPGFTRGLDFFGPFAFIGLSQVRETAVFSGLAITEHLQERVCGVWVVDLRTGQTKAFLQFQAGVQEIFAVQVLRSIRFPDILPDDEEIIANSFVLPR